SQNGAVDIASLAAYVRKNVYDHVSGAFTAEQTPQCVIDAAKPMVLVKIGTAAAANPTQTAVIPNGDAENKASASAAVATGDELTIDLGRGMKLELAKIPAGSFEMGSPK